MKTKKTFAMKLTPVVQVGVAMVALALCTVTSQATPPEPLTIELGISGFEYGVWAEGPFEAWGAINTSGTYHMDLKIQADTIHCEATLTDSDGNELYLQMRCKMVWIGPVMTGPGRWVINGGTGIYEHFHAVGSLEMLFDGQSDTVEFLDGTGFFDNGK